MRPWRPCLSASGLQPRRQGQAQSPPSSTGPGGKGQELLAEGQARAKARRQGGLSRAGRGARAGGARWEGTEAHGEGVGHDGGLAVGECRRAGAQGEGYLHILPAPSVTKWPDLAVTIGQGHPGSERPPGLRSPCWPMSGPRCAPSTLGSGLQPPAAQASPRATHVPSCLGLSRRPPAPTGPVRALWPEWAEEGDGSSFTGFAPGRCPRPRSTGCPALAVRGQGWDLVTSDPALSSAGLAMKTVSSWPAGGQCH